MTRRIFEYTFIFYCIYVCCVQIKTSYLLT